MARRPPAEAPLPFSPVRNSELFANHWLESRLRDEPEWNEQRDNAGRCLEALAALWNSKRAILTPGIGEHTMEDEWVHPVLAALGWQFIYQTIIRTRKPDYALFLAAEEKAAAYSAGKQSPDFWKPARLVADAKVWDRRLDRPARSAGGQEYPPEQIEEYLRLTALDWGLLTNGRLWRLSPRALERSQPRFETYFEIDLPEALDRWLAAQRKSKIDRANALDEFMPWYLLATPVAFLSPDGRVPLIERARKGSTEYRVAVGGALRGQVFEALRWCIEGFLSHKPNGLDPARDMAECRANAFTLLFRLLFILFAEDRTLLPHGRNPAYTKACSLSRQHSDLAGQLLSERGTAVWDDWKALFAIIDAGKATYAVPAYNGGLFDSASHDFLNRVALSDAYAYRVLDQLRRTPEDPGDDSSDRVRVDYRDLAIQHLGNVYEGLLELHPRYVAEPMVVVRGRSEGKMVERTIPVRDDPPEGFEATATTHAAGEVYLETDKGERRATGSYYTPDHIVAYIVENTLGPLCAEIDEKLHGEIAAADAEHRRARGGTRQAWERDLARLKADFDDRVLRLAVVDPSMGSGHFLLRACQFLAEQIATNPNADDADAPGGAAAGDEPTLLFWKRRVVERCLYGVDKNPVAVELAKLALWLETVSVDQPLSFLDHHLRHGDSLIGASVDTIGALHDPKVKGGAQVRTTLEHQTDTMLRPLDEIRAMPSSTVAQVKEKERLYRQTFEPRRRPFKHLADLWVADFFTASKADRLTAPEYHAAVQLLGRPGNFATLMGDPRYAAALGRATAPGIDAFHWELEFPEVFLSPARRRAGRAGFDAVIGNPPYDVLAEKELGRDLSQLKGFIGAMPVYEPSRRGKNNLYKLFICRALDLLAEGGRLGFIVPMAVLGDDQSADIRRAIFKAGALTGVEAFPQKDDPARRVFPEAKLSTAVFHVKKTGEAAARGAPFRARQHPANMIEEGSPSLRLATDQIPRYDPENLSIVSCSQEDWDFAVRIMGSGRMQRLSEYATSFQGEINETNERPKETISYNADEGDEAIRGAHVCLYTIRDASQGTAVFVRRTRFLDGKAADTKAFHHRYNRIGFQRKSPQNNFRRLIASLIPANTFLLESVSYTTTEHCRLPLETVLVLLNSTLCEWFFRLGSTNAMVSEYQFNILPCPIFAAEESPSDARLRDAALAAIRASRPGDAFDTLRPALANPPFPKAAQDILADLARRIIRAEQARGPITRAQRSELSADAQPLQALIDRILYTMAGLTDAEARGLEERLARML